MKLWAVLFAMVWLVVAQFFLALLPLAGLTGPELLFAHLALGVVLIALAIAVYRRILATRAPARIKNMTRASIPVMALMAATGALLFSQAALGFGLPGGTLTFGTLLVLHVIGALAVLAHSTGAAVAYDMWESRDFEKLTDGGKVPPPTIGAGSTTGGRDPAR